MLKGPKYMKELLVKYKIFLAIVTLLAASFVVYFIIEQNTMTNNAFAVANVRPVASEVSGYINQVNVQNGQTVQKGDKLFSINSTQYRYKLNLAESEFSEAKFRLVDLVSKRAWLAAQLEIREEEYQLAKIHFEDAHELIKKGAISEIETQTYQFSFYESKQRVLAVKQENVHLENQIMTQKSVVKANKAKVDLAQYALNHTIIYAQSNGFIANMFIAVGTPVKALEPLFSFVDTDRWFVQANYDETDLSHVQIGDKAIIRFRTYLGEKIYYGKVISINWAVNRQKTSQKNYLQEVENENQWVLLPQRFPVLVEVEDNDPNYPQRVGASAYVEIKT
jgi:multidrug resistance efflux pump